MALQIIFSGASLVLCAFFFVYFHLYIRRRTRGESVLAGYRDEVNRLIAEIDRATDRDARLVEERIASLRKFLEEADRRIALLSRDLDRRRAGAELYTALGKTVSAPGSPPDQASSPGASLAAASPPGQAPGAGLVAASLPGQASSPAASLAAASPPDQVPAPRPLTERAAELSRQGFSAELIASRLGVSISE
ncbi:MAG: hypothetical protein LBQ46_10200, partial [Treponema sp.]|nr:hypothetical protein [Treponema sp.]